MFYILTIINLILNIWILLEIIGFKETDSFFMRKSDFYDKEDN